MSTNPMSIPPLKKSPLACPTLTNLPHLPSVQGGASVSGIVMFLVMMGFLVKLGLGIIPAQVGDYQLTKSIGAALKKSNAGNETPQQFMAGLESQWNVNGIYRKPADILTITDPTPGKIAVHKEYQEVSNLFGDIDIVNRFKGDITAEDAKLTKN